MGVPVLGGLFADLDFIRPVLREGVVRVTGRNPYKQSNNRVATFSARQKCRAFYNAITGEEKIR